MNQERKHGRALQLDGLLDTQVKVTVGFKCEPHVKMTLATESQTYGMSLSEYVETIVNNRNRIETNSADSSTQTAELSALKKENKLYKEKLSFFYDNVLIRRAFDLHKGKTIRYTTASGVKKSAYINSMEDVYKVLIEISNLA